MKRENAVLILLVGICKMREREEKSEIKVKSSRIENKDFAKIIKKNQKTLCLSGERILKNRRLASIKYRENLREKQKGNDFSRLY